MKNDTETAEEYFKQYLLHHELLAPEYIESYVEQKATHLIKNIMVGYAASIISERAKEVSNEKVNEESLERFSMHDKQEIFNASHFRMGAKWARSKFVGNE